MPTGTTKVNVSFKRGALANLPTSGLVEGGFYLTTDEGGFYNVVNGSLKRISDYVVVASQENLPATGISTLLYYCESENILCKWDTTAQDYIQVNSTIHSSHYEGVRQTDETDSAAITRIVGSATPIKGDTLVIKTLLATDTYSYTGFVYDGSVWKAMDGNYSAENVYFEDDITLAGDYTAVGNLTKTKTGTATFSVAGKTVAEAMTEMLSKRLQPGTPTQPAVTLTFSQAGAYEVGTTVTPSYSASLSAGSYTYGPATGITATAWEISDTDGHTATTSSGSFDAITVADGENYTITAKATYDDGAVAKDNLGSNSNPEVKISGGSKSKTSAAITGYRSFFYGVLDTTTADAPLTSAIVRGLTNGGAYNAAKEFVVNATATAKRIVIAIPHASITATRAGVDSVILTSAMNTPVTDSYTKTVSAVDVEGVDGAVAVSYDVWVYEPAAIDAGEVHKITLK